MSTAATTQVLPALDLEDPRIQLLQDTWVLTIFTVLLSAALPYFVSTFDIEFGTASWGVLGLGVIYLALTAIGELAHSSAVWRTRALALVHAAGVVLIGFVWQHAGGLQNPAFLLAFALPVIGASFISRWQPYVVAALAILVVTAVALSQAPELRWYVTGLNTAGARVAALFGARDVAVAAPFAGFYAPSGYFVVLLEAFAVLLLACGAAAEYLGTVFARLSARISAALAEAHRGRELWTTLIEQLPAPALLVDADTLQVICASERFAAQYCAAEAAAVAGGNLFETTHFSYPDVVQELIAGKDGVVRPSMIRVADQLRVAEVRVQHVAQRGRRLALVIIEDITEGFCAKAALDTAEYAALVVNSQGRLMTFNKSAPGLVPGSEFATAASRLLSHPTSGARWWDPGVSGRRKMHVELLQRIFQVTSSTITLPGEEENFSVIAFLPIGRATGPRPSTAGSTLVKSTLIQLK
jgi:hypothetical protein